jgi:hypothetical protein
VSSPITAMLRREWARTEAQIKAKAPKSEDWNRFYEAARGLIAIDPEFRHRLKSPDARSRLLNGPIDTPAAEDRLRKHLLHSMRSASKYFKAKDDATSGFRGLMAFLTAAVLTADRVDRDALNQVSGQLFELRKYIERTRRREHGRRARADVDPAAVQWVEEKAREWRENNPKATQNEGLKHLYSESKKAAVLIVLARKNGKSRLWPNVPALRAWMYRNKLRI